MSTPNPNIRSVRQDMPENRANRPAQDVDIRGQIVFSVIRFGVRPPPRPNRALRYGNAYREIEALQMDHVEPIDGVKRKCSHGILLPCIDRKQVHDLYYAIRNNKQAWCDPEKSAQLDRNWYIELARDEDHMSVWVRKVSIYEETEDYRVSHG